MKYFITNNKAHKVPKNIEVLDRQEALFVLRSSFFWDDPNAIMAIDFETTGLLPNLHPALLCVIKTPQEDSFCFDLTDGQGLSELSSFSGCWLAHNMLFDYQVAKAQSLVIDRLACSQAAFQVVYRGFEFSASLVNVHKTLLKEVPKEMQKDIRDEFIGQDVSKAVFTERQIAYAFGDVERLVELYNKICFFANRRNVYDYLERIAYPTIKAVGEGLYYGNRFDAEKWKGVTEEDIEHKERIEVELDKELVNLRNTLPKVNTTALTGKYNRIRDNWQHAPVGKDLFGNIIKLSKKERDKIRALKNKRFVNWNSTTQKSYIFEALRLDLPEIEEYNNTKASFAKSAVEQYIRDYEGKPQVKLASLLLDYSEKNAMIDKFGYTFIEDFVQRDGRVYTSYRTEGASTGRFQSGNKDNGMYNSQNIPRDNRRRSCFIGEENHLVWTGDLGSAEGVIMASHAQDLKMMENLDDLHSYLATKCWRAILKNRAKLWVHVPEKYKTLMEEAENFVVSKSENKKYRQEFKAVTYGIPYGAFPPKIAKALNIDELEGVLVKRTVEAEILRVTQFMSKNVRSALNDGYIVFNTRNNVRMQFLPVIIAKKTCIKNNVPYSPTMIDHFDKKNIEGNARNAPIQGTQAEMMKESLVEIFKVLNHNNIAYPDIKFMKMVHDEYVFSINKNIVEKEIEVYHDLYDKKDNFIVGSENKGERKVVPLHEGLADIMKIVCNRYLKNIKMDIDYVVTNSWQK